MYEKIKKIPNIKNKKKKQQYRNAIERSYISYRYYFDLNLGKDVDVENYTSSYLDYPNVRSGCHRKFSTKQEKSLFELHEIEYKKEFNLQLRRRRSKKNLPDPWDDYPSFVYDLEKSWKNSTKRKRQYYK